MVWFSLKIVVTIPIDDYKTYIPQGQSHRQMWALNKWKYVPSFEISQVPAPAVHIHYLSKQKCYTYCFFHFLHFLFSVTVFSVHLCPQWLPLDCFAVFPPTKNSKLIFKWKVEEVGFPVFFISTSNFSKLLWSRVLARISPLLIVFVGVNLYVLLLTSWFFSGMVFLHLSCSTNSLYLSLSILHLSNSLLIIERASSLLCNLLLRTEFCKKHRILCNFTGSMPALCFLNVLWVKTKILPQEHSHPVADHEMLLC